MLKPEHRPCGPPWPSLPERSTRQQDPSHQAHQVFRAEGDQNWGQFLVVVDGMPPRRPPSSSEEIGHRWRAATAGFRGLAERSGRAFVRLG
jgi:hypothetical protein